MRAFARRAGWLAACLCGSTAAAQGSGDAVMRVEAYLATTRTLTAEFTQVVRSRDGAVTGRSAGTLSLARPDRFRWDYREPYLQTIVADGQRLWLYDSDLAQVTVRSLESGLGATPAMLLSGTGRVGEAFASIAVEQAGPWTWCRLRPKAAGADFERVGLAFDAGGELAAMQLEDKLGQSTTIEFAEVRRNTPLDEALFRFTPPPGADVIGEATP